MKEKLFIIFNRINEYILYALIFFIPISTAAIEVFSGWAVFSFLGKKIIKPDFEFIKTQANFFLLIFIVFSSLSLINSAPYLSKSLHALVTKWFQYLWIFIFAQDALSSRRNIRRAIIILLASSAFVGIDGLSQRFFGVEFLRHRQLIDNAITASFKHYNSLGGYLAALFPLIISLLLAPSWIKKHKWSLFALGIILAVCILLTFSRGSWLGVILSLFFILFLSRKAKIFVPIIVIFLCAILLTPFFKQRFLFTFQPQGDSGRFTIWAGALRMIKENPFLGKGIGTFMDRFPNYAPGLSMQYAHNSFLQIWAETGIFSLISLFLFFISLLSNGIIVFRKNKDYALLGLIGGVFAFLAHSFFDNHFYSMQLSVLFWLMAGMLTALSRATLYDS